jgi:AcrR family transcriptional regulator
MATHSTCTRLLTAAAQVVSRDGAADLTLEAVAREAGVSKGGLLYHFPSKAALVLGLVAQAIEEVDTYLSAAIAIDPTPGAFTRAYVRVTMVEDDAGEGLAAALMATAASDPRLLQPLREAYDRWNVALRADGLPAGRALVVRLAADGWWLSHLTGLGALATEEDALVTRMLLELAGEPA